MKTRTVLSLLGAFLLTPLALSACTSTRPTDLPPYPGSSFTVSVRAGESLKAVADRFQVKEDDLLALNKIDNRASLTGGRIRIPAYGWDREPVGGVVRQEAPRQEPPRQEPPRQQATYQASARVDARALDAPAVTSTRQTRVAGNTPSRPRAQAPDAQQTAQPTQAAPQSSWLGEMFSPVQPQATSTVPEQKFLWPVKGRVISAFGQAAGGGRNDGINISAKLGTPVHAADAGTVSYVGNELKSYGNLVLIRHDNGYVTAYAHAERIDVQRGDRVARGQVIGSAGETGDVTEPQVHFELRLGTRPVDPTPYLVASN